MITVTDIEYSLVPFEQECAEASAEERGKEGPHELEVALTFKGLVRAETPHKVGSCASVAEQ